MYERVCVCVCVYIYVYLYVGCRGQSGAIDWYIYMYVYVCIYIYICIYMYIYVYIYIHVGCRGQSGAVYQGGGGVNARSRYVCWRMLTFSDVCGVNARALTPHTSAYVSIRQHTYLDRALTPHTSAYVICWRLLTYAAVTRGLATHFTCFTRTKVQILTQIGTI
jgi:hypothetical protein